MELDYDEILKRLPLEERTQLMAKKEYFAQRGRNTAIECSIQAESSPKMGDWLQKFLFCLKMPKECSIYACWEHSLGD